MTSIDPLQFAPSRNPQDPPLPFANPMQQQAAEPEGIVVQDPRIDAYEATARKIKQQEDDAFMRAFVRTTKTSPEFAAEAQKLGIDLNLDPKIVEENIERARELQRKRVLENLQLSQGNEPLAQIMLDPEFAAIAHDQTSQLNFLQKLFAHTKSGYLQSEQGRIYDRIRTGNATEADRARAIELDDALFALPQDSSGAGIAGIFYGTGKTLGQFGETLPRAIAGAAVGAGVAFGLGQLGPQAGLPEELISMPTMAWAGFRGEMFASTAAVEAGQSYKSMIDMGVSHDTAARTAGYVGLVNGLFEVVGFSSFTSTARKEIAQAITRSAAKELILQPSMTKAAIKAAVAYGKDAGGEIATEIGQEITAIIAEQSAIAQQMTDDPTKLDWEAINSQTGFVERIGSIIAETARGVGLISAIGPMVGLRQDVKRIAEAKRLEKFITGLTKGVEDTALSKRSPMALERYLATLSQGSAVENVYFKPEDFAKAMEAAGISETQMAEMAPEVWKAFQESKDTGIIEMPTHTWGAKFLTGEFGKALSQDARVDPDGVSIREVRKAYTEEDKAIEERANKILAEKDETDRKFITELVTVRDDMKKQLLAANPRITNEQATNEARLYGHFVTVYSVNEKVSPLEWHQTRGLRVIGAEKAPAFGDALQQLTTEERALVEQTKIRSEEGKPLRLYHGTTATFKRFRKGKNGIWFAYDPQEAQPGSGETATQTKAVYVSSKNPYTLTEKERNELIYSASPKAWATKKIAELRNKGHDAMIVPGYAVVAFEKKQVVNAIGAKLEAPLQQLGTEEGAEGAPAEPTEVETEAQFEEEEPTVEPTAEIVRPKLGKAVDAPEGDLDTNRRNMEKGNVLGFWELLRVVAPKKRPKPKVTKSGKVKQPKPKILTGTSNKNARKQLSQLDGILAAHPNAHESASAWANMTADAFESQEVPAPPFALIRDLKGNRMANKLKTLTKGQIEDANHGFENAAEFRRAYIAGEISVVTTAKLFLWSFLSRGVSPYTQESLFVDAFEGAVEWIKKAARGEFTEADFDEYTAWAKSVAPKGSGQPGAGATHNLNAFGRLFLFKMGQKNAQGISHLQHLHNMMSDANASGKMIRREFATFGQGVGIDNKVVSFTLLVAGFKDVMVLDRVQVRQLWDDGRFAGYNLYDGVKVSRVIDGKQKNVKVAGSSLTELTMGVRGILIYEAVERALQQKIKEAYAAVGRADDASIGRYHWESWVADSQQEASHGTLDAILRDAKGDDQAIAQVTAKQGEYGAYEYGARYGRDKNGGYFLYQVENGKVHRFTVPQFRAFLTEIKKRSAGVVPKDFKVTEAGNKPWYQSNGVNKKRLDELAADYSFGPQGRRVAEEDARAKSAALSADKRAADRAARSNKLARTHGILVDARSRRGNDPESWGVTREGVEDGGGLRVLGAKVVAKFRLGNLLADRLRQAGDNPDAQLYELDPNDPQSSIAFHEAISAFKVRKKEHGASVYVYDVDKYQGMRLLLTEDGQNGVAVKPDGDIVSVFAGKGAARFLVESAISIGGTKADAFDIGLAELYSGHGLKVVSRIKWDEREKPEGWDKVYFYDFNKGEPDVLFMVVDPSYVEMYRGAKDGKKAANYGKAVEIQMAAVEAAKTAKPPQPAALNAPTGRGRYYEALRTAVLEKDADPSTVIHEMSHFFFTTMVRVASGPNPPVQVREDVEALLRWFSESGGLKLDEGDMVLQWNNLSAEQQERFHEMLAYNFEIYAFEGQAPAPQLESLFARMRTWMIRVYKDIRTQLNFIYKQNFGTDLPVMNAEVRMVFDRMLAAKEVVEQAEAIRHMLPLFMDQESFIAAGYTEEEWDDYQAALQEAHEAAVTDLTRASLAQLRWLTNARSRALKQIQKEGAKVRKQVEARIREQVEQEQIYIVINLLKGDQAASKLSYDAVEKRLAGLEKKAREAAIKKLGTGRRGMLAKTSEADLDVTAQVLGYESGDQLLQALIAAPNMEQKIYELTNQEMADQFGEFNNPAQMEMAVEKALHNEARARFIAVEQRFLSRSTKPTRLLLLSARFTARRIIEGRSIRSLRPDKYAQAEAAAARDAERASRGVDGRKAGDPRAAVAAKERQLLNNQLVVESRAAKQEVEKITKFFTKLNRGNDKLAKGGYDVNIVNIARWLAARVGLLSETMTERTVDYLEMLQKYNPTMFQELSPILDRFKDARLDYRDLKLSEFLALADAVKSLWAQARRADQIRVEGKRVSARTSAQTMYDQVQSLIPKEIAGTTKALTAGEKVGRLLLGTKASLTRMEHLVRMLDGGERGPFAELMHDELRLGLDKYRRQAAVFTKKLVEMIRALPLDKSDIDAKEFGYTFKGDAELIGLLLHLGNKSNAEKALIAGRTTAAGYKPWASFDINGELDQSQWIKLRDRLIESGRLKQIHFDFAQKVWDMMEEIKPLLQEAHMELEGYLFKEVPAQEFTVEFKDGTKKTYRGGYVPAAADRDLMGTGQDPMTPDSMEQDFKQEIPKVNFGSVKERIDQYRGRPLTLDVNQIAQHIDKSMRFAYVQPRLRDVLRVLNVAVKRDDGTQTTLGASLNAIHPNLVKDVVVPWLERAATQTLYKPGGDPLWNAIGKFIRANTGVAIMMFNPVNALQQFTGISNSFNYVKAGYLVNALNRYMRERKDLVDWIVKTSDFMNDRLNNQMGAMRAELDQMLLDPGSWARVQEWTTRKAYSMQAMVQNQVDIVTWTGAFDQAMARLKDGETAEQQQRRAVLEANSAVRLSQGSFSPEDVARYEVGTPWQRAWTQFTGYFNNVLNAIGYSNNKVRAALLSFTIPMMISEAIAKELWGQWKMDDPDQEDWMLDGIVWDGLDIMILSQIRGAAAFAPAAGPAIANVIESAFSQRGFGDKVAASPSITTMYRGANGLVELLKATADEEKDATGKSVRDTMTFINQVTGAPLAPLARPAGYMMDWASGKIVPTGWWDIFKGLSTGRASLASQQ